MKNLLITLLTAIVAAQVLVAMPNNMVQDIAPYVYPQNIPAAPPSFVYAPDGQGYFMLSADKKSIDRYDTKTGNKIETVFDVRNTRGTTISDIEGFEIGANMRYFLVYRDSEKIYRRSFKASYYIYEPYSRQLRPLSKDFTKQRAPILSPSSRMVAFVADDNNIYIKKLDYDSQVAVTRDGAINKIINGVPDWVYEEEFSVERSMVWSPDDLTLCYLRYDESAVPMYTLPIYEGTCNPQSKYRYYPGSYAYKYPVAGEPNSAVTLHSYDVETRKIKDIPLPDSRIEYIPSIHYGDIPERLMVATLNRDQTRLELYSVNPKSTVVKSIYVDDSKAWIQESAYSNIHYRDDGFIIMSSRTGYNHLYQYSYAGALVKTLTSGDFDVTACYGIDAKGCLYYQAAKPTPMDRVVYKVDPKGKVFTLNGETGTNSAEFAPDMSCAMMMHSDVATPPVYTINSADGKVLRTLEANTSYAARYAAMPKKEFFTMTSDGVELNGFIIKPVDFSPSKKYPVIMTQYSGPGSQQVLNKWAMDWEQYAATQNYVVICVDGRGTGGRGRKFMDVVYRNLGHYETIDQINAAKYAAQLPYVDAKRIGICGWSYGGYETLMAASAPGAPYAAAVSIAPVTDWRYYDTVYTERYMLTPQQNESGYDSSSALARTASLCCPLLIMYGTSDDNVHPENSLQYVSKLQSESRFCDMLVFPNMNHSIYGCGARAVVYAKMLDYFNGYLQR